MLGAWRCQCGHVLVCFQTALPQYAPTTFKEALQHSHVLCEASVVVSEIKVALVIWLEQDEPCVTFVRSYVRQVVPCGRDLTSVALADFHAAGVAQDTATVHQPGVAVCGSIVPSA